MTDKRWDEGIRRCNLDRGLCEDIECEMLESSYGSYCDSDDVQRVIESKDAEIARLQQALKDATEWRPMSTAPRDGTEIAVFTKRLRLAVVEHVENDTWCGPGIACKGSDLLGHLPIPPWKEPKP